MSSASAPRVLVACLGSSVVRDDRVGEAVHARLAADRRLPPGTRLVHLGLGGTELVDELRAEELLIVVDAVRIGARPGTVHVIEWADVQGALPTRAAAHDLGLPQALELTRLLFPERAPRRVVLVGVQGRCFDELGEMSPEVAAAVDRAADAVVDLALRAGAARLPEK